MSNTRDLSEFGFTELKEAGRLLTAYCENKDILGDKVVLEFNPSSGKVFLVDEDFKVCMMNGDALEEWFYCPQCGHEGFKEDMKHGNENDTECQEYLEQIGALTSEEMMLRKL